MSGTKNHDYHILPTSINPLLGSISALVMFFGLVRWMHDMAYGTLIFGAGAIGLAYVFFAWWSDVIAESHAGDHTPVVQLHLRYGMILFIASEVMFFVGWFWAWFDFSLFPSAAEVIGGQWPPVDVEVLDPLKLPLLNTLILLCSGTTVTWAHHSLIHGNRQGLIRGLGLTIILGIAFSTFQFVEYVEAPFPFAGLNYGTTFYMATGFHGAHVLIGTIFLIVCFVRALKGDFTPKKHFGFEAAAWYWHFVDVVWLFLFIVIYVWGGWGAPVHG